MVLISAHDAGQGSGADPASLRAAVRSGSLASLPGEYVEIDVSITADGAYVCRHDQTVWIDGAEHQVSETSLAELRVARPDLVLLDEALAAVAGRRKVHLDVKLDQVHPLLPGADFVRLAQQAVRRLGSADVLVTTGARGVAAIRGWSRAACPELLVGLTLTPSWRSLARLAWWSLTGLGNPVGAQLHGCDANLLAAHYLSALLGVRRWARRAGLPLLVWTVDSRPGLRYWLRNDATYAVCTNHPLLASTLRTRR